MVVWELPAAGKRRPAVARRAPSELRLERGWVLVESKGPALGQADARSFAKEVAGSRGHVKQPWAVRGELPVDDDKGSCGCTGSVFDGIRMQLPEKMFGHSWMELRHEELDLAFCFDSIVGLQRWAQLSIDLVNDRRSGRTVWSGWTGDNSKLQKVWEQSIWAAEGGSYSHREEWDWVYRTDYMGTVHRAAAQGHSQKRAIAAQQHKLIRLSKKGKNDSASMDE